MNTNAQGLITEAELDDLEAFLFSDSVSEDALDLIGAHGLLCAVNISPVEIPEAEWMALLFDSEPEWASEEEKNHYQTLLRKLHKTLASDLYNDQETLLPCELTLDTDEDEDLPELTIWAQSFMEGVFLREEEWFGRDEETVAGMLLPIMVASELFEDTEILEIRQDRALSEEMAEQIPELLVDLYLYFHAPDK
ncbi:YecA/YgfB family protein [Nitrincola tapanii]|uniref:YecA family protein n=1 Tax=Nitrincola tapanii TaxID=1708751 RepID=A0A5A9W168_9GAMM|nr:YecA family protein [Nitrincola tapanii]KAA0873959.1 YecA family protein [Nitrincola tapanii]